MRLIDLDKALTEAEDECRMSDDWKASHEMMNVFKYQPTVKAIPIEWFENWKRGKTSIEQVVADKIMMDYKYRDWEKENETN